jgi:ribonuclease T1
VFRTGLASPSGKLRRAWRKWGAAVVVASGLATGAATLARTPEQPGRGAVALAELPAEAQATHRLILAGGPFPYSKDGTVFGNRERLLPAKARGHYREYTVPTPGARNRGARRIVCGGRPPTQPESCFYTDDHYSSFRRIQP